MTSQYIKENEHRYGDQDLRWLKTMEKNNEHICIVSYPRSGNSLMRGLLEKITGVYTGSDTLPERSLSKRLQECGMKGEGVVDDSVWFVKSHFPERYGYKEFKAKKAILVVRNPWDAINSYFNMSLTNSHNTSIAESQYARFSDIWDKLIRNEIEVWMKFHLYWTKKQPLPLIIVRYEDLLVHREECLKRVLRFINDEDGEENNKNWDQIIKQTVMACENNVSPYKPRSGKIGSSFKYYSEEQFNYVLQKANLWLTGFGYDTEKQKFPENIPMPKRQVKATSMPNAELIINKEKVQIRKPNDTFGRLFSRFRKRLTDPVISNDGLELNLHEIENARKHHQIKQSDSEQNAY